MGADVGTGGEDEFVSYEVVKMKGDMCTDAFEVFQCGRTGDDKNVGRGAGGVQPRPKSFPRFSRCVRAI
jgi:hypothetical protein